MSSSVTLSIATNSAIAASKAFGWFVTGSPTLFAETIHSLADVGNQVLLKVGEVRSRRAPDRRHPFGSAQEKFFWALVSAAGWERMNAAALPVLVVVAIAAGWLLWTRRVARMRPA